MSVILIVTVLIAASMEHGAPSGALLFLTAVTVVPAIAVDVLVFIGPRKRPFRDPLARHPEDKQNEEGEDSMTAGSDEPK